MNKPSHMTYYMGHMIKNIRAWWFDLLLHEYDEINFSNRK